MLVLILLLVAFCFIKAKPQRKNERNTFLNRNITLSISGLFAGLVFCSHLFSYLDLNSINQFDLIGVVFTSELGQLVVAPFLFYSGYGVIESFKKKGMDYAKSYPKKRILKLYIVFINSVLLYVILSLAIRMPYSPSRYVLSVFGLDDLGNSRWYVIVILLLYFISYLSFIFFREFDRKGMVIFHILFGIILYFSLQKMGLQVHWYNTIIAYIFGVVISCYKDNFVNFMTKNKSRPYILLVCSMIIFFMFFYLLPTLTGTYGGRSPFYPLAVVFFCLLIVSLTAVVQIQNKILLFLGQNSFWIYMLQRAPMILFNEISTISQYRYVYVLLCIAGTALIIAYLNYMKKVSKPIFTKIKF